MDNDKAFTAYALTLVAVITSVITASVMAGFATLPTAGVFIEHLALSVGFRAAYKSFGGIDWVYTLADTLGLYENDHIATPPAGGAQALG